MNTSSSDGSLFCQCKFAAVAIRRDAGFQRGMVAAGDVQRGAERRHHVDAGLAGELGGKPVEVVAGDVPGRQRRLRDHLLDRAVRQQIAIGDIGDLVTALGLVHVMGGDQHGQPVGGERVDLVPEIAPRLGIDAGGRLVEQQQLRARQRAGAEREPLLPAAGEFAGELLLAAGKAEPLDHVARGVARLRACRRAARRIRGSRAPRGPGTARSAASCSRPAA